MTSELISQILTVLATMKGYPSMPSLVSDDQPMDPVRASYAKLLVRMPDGTGLKVRDGVLLRFDERPSVKNLADWAQSLGPAQIFDIRQLDGPGQTDRTGQLDGPGQINRSPSHRAGGMDTPGLSALAAAQDAGRAAIQDAASTPGKRPIPETAKAIFRQLQVRSRADSHRSHAGPAVTGNWGLVHVFEDGRTEHCPAIHSEEEARRRQAEICRKYTHFQCRVYQKSVSAPS